VWVHGVVADDRSDAVFALATTATGIWSPPGRVRLPGLDPDALYRVSPLSPGDELQGPTKFSLEWWATGVDLSGRTLAVAGVQAPVLFPERLVLIRTTRR
jgi:alpha-galactosidase